MPVEADIKKFFLAHVSVPEIQRDAETGEAVVIPASYSLEGPHKEEIERVLRAASAASGIIPLPEDLTAQAEARAASGA